MNSIIYLDSETYLKCVIHPQKQFSDDEMEIWMVKYETELCLFKDSYKYAFLTDSLSTFSYVLSTSDNVTFSDLEDSFRNSEDTNCFNHILFDVADSLTWLTKSPDSDKLKIEIWDMRSEKEEYTGKYSEKYNFDISKDGFNAWLDSIQKEMQMSKDSVL